MRINARKIRDRVALNISPHTATAVGITYAELCTFVSGSHHLDEATLVALASWLKMRPQDVWSR